jgi:transposase
VERARLKSYLDAGMSLDAIARQVGKHPSTVSYWLRKHGLEANGGARHQPRGGIRRESLEPLIQEGLPVREIAARLDRSQSSVRYWIDQYMLPSPKQVRNRAKDDARSRGDRTVERECAKHGSTVFVVENSGRARCRRCRQEAVVRWRRRVKARLVAEAGGACAICGYDRCSAALEFHHLDPATKSFGLSAHHVTRGFEELLAEARKCVLLCGNCHAEVEAGVTTVP